VNVLDSCWLEVGFPNGPWVKLHPYTTLKKCLKILFLVALKLTFPGLDVAAKSGFWRKFSPK
jgi:hypothetical protein